MDKVCAEIRDLFALGSDTSPNERIAVESHVSICADCARELAESRSLIGHLELLREGEMPPGAAERIWRGVESAVPGRRRPAFLAWSMKAAAVLAIGLSVGFTAVSIGRSTSVPDMTAGDDTADDAPSTLIRHPVEPAFGRPTAEPVPSDPPDEAGFQVLTQLSSSSYYLAPVEKLLDSDEVRF